MLWQTDYSVQYVAFQCQKATPIEMLWSRLKKLPNLSLLLARTFWNQKTFGSNYGKLKSRLRTRTVEPTSQQSIKQTREVLLSFFGAAYILFSQRNAVGILAHWLAPRPLSFAASLRNLHLKKYVCFLLTRLESIRIFSTSQGARMANKRLSKDKQALVLAALCEGTPIRACARMFKTSKNTIKRVIRETGEAFSDYMDKNFRDLPCIRIEMDEQWQYVGAHGSRLIKPEAERGDFWLWCCIDADTKLVFSHRVGKRDWWTGNQFVEDVRNRVKLPVQIATDNHRPYAFHIRQHFGYEGFSYGTETKIFGEPKLSDGTLARLGRNEGVRRMQTAERKAVVGSPDLESLTTSHVEHAFLTVRQELKRFERKGLGYSKSLEMHKLAVALHFGVYNFVRKHHTLGRTPAVAAGLEEKPWSLEKVVEMTEAYFRGKSGSPGLAK
jgi:IS1 family transposase